MSEFEWTQLVVLCVAGAASPGLSWVLITQMSVQNGVGAGIRGALGHGLGITLFALATVLGLSWVLQWMPNLSIGLHGLGIGLLVYFSVQLWRHSAAPVHGALTAHSGFWVGMAMALINPKVLVFFVAIFAPYAERSTVITERLLMGGLAGLIDAAVYIGVAIAASSARTLLYGARLKWLNRAVSGLLMAGAMWLVLQPI